MITYPIKNIILQVYFLTVFLDIPCSFVVFKVEFNYDVDAALSKAKHTLEKRCEEIWGMVKHVHTD
jgi:hypothetical protein